MRPPRFAYRLLVCCTHHVARPAASPWKCEKASTMPNTELQQATALAEVSPATSEELEWCQRALSAVPEPQRELFAAIPVDVRAVCCMRRALSPRASSRLSSVALILNATG